SIKKVDPKLFELLNIFVDKTYSQYREFVDNNPSFLRDSKLANNEAEMDAISIKIRLLTLATLASQFVDGEMPYSAVAESLNIPESDVEMWIIDGIRAGLIDGKMNQLKRAVIVSRSTYRVFGEQHWSLLSAKLDGWRSNLREVLQVLSNAKLMAAAEPSVPVDSSPL
ncbi:hypothetical protein HK405_012554, partial [Cladochytrium tenue]